MGYFDILNRALNEYLCISYSEDVEIQAILNSYKEGEDLELFEAVDRELLYEFIEAQELYGTLSNEGLEELILASEDYIGYFMDCSLSEVYEYYGEVDIKTVLLQTDLYKYNDIYYLIWREDYISYFMDCSLNEVYEYYDEVDI